MMQAVALGEVASIAQAREMIRNCLRWKNIIRRIRAHGIMHLANTLTRRLVFYGDYAMAVLTKKHRVDATTPQLEISAVAFSTELGWMLLQWEQDRLHGLRFVFLTRREALGAGERAD